MLVQLSPCTGPINGSLTVNNEHTACKTRTCQKKSKVVASVKPVYIFAGFGKAMESYDAAGCQDGFQTHQKQYPFPQIQ